MSVRINFVVSDDFYDQINLMCDLNSTTKSEFIRALIRDEMAVFFENQKQVKRMKQQYQKKREKRRTQAIENEFRKENGWIEIGVSHVFPPAY